MATWKQYLKKIYYDPASFAGPDKLYRFVRQDGKFVLSKIQKMVTTTRALQSSKTLEKVI
jgi:hypothetical protein